MKILLITQYFPPEMGAPQARLYELAARMVRKGHSVTVLTAMPNYPTGRVFRDYRWKLRCRESMDGIEVVRTAIFPSKSQGVVSRLLSYASFAFSSLFLGPWGIKRPDVTVIESPPLFLMPTSLLLATLFRSKRVMMVSDIWPDIIERMGYRTKGFYLTLMKWLERFSYRFSDVVALTNPGAKEQISARFPNVVTTVISNGVDRGLFDPSLSDSGARKRLGVSDDSFLVVYCGLHGIAQGLDAVVGAASLIPADSKVHMVMIGDGPVKGDLLRKAKDLNLQNLSFFDPIPKKEVPSILSTADASLVPLSCRLPGTMPSKVYEALASGTPPIVAKGCEGATLVDSTSSGLSFEPGDAADLARAIIEASSNPMLWSEKRERALELSRRFDRDVIAERTELILKAIVDGEALPAVEW